MPNATGVAKVHSGYESGSLYFWHTGRERTAATTLMVMSSTGVTLGTAGSDVDWTVPMSAATQVTFNYGAKTVYFGESDDGVDIYFYGATAGDWVYFDETNDRMQFEDITLRMMDDTNLAFGDSSDFLFRYDSSNTQLEIVPAAANDEVWFGDGTTNPDVRFAGSDSTNKILIDSSADQLQTTGMSFLMGTTDRIYLRDSAISIYSDADANMQIVSDGDIYLNGKVEHKINIETLAAMKSLTVTDTDFQFLDPDGAARTVNLPATSTATRKMFLIANTADGAETITVVTTGGTTRATIDQNEAALLVCSGATWNTIVGGLT